MKGTRFTAFTSILASLCFTAGLTSQTQYTLDLDSAKSNFEFNGDSNVGRIVGTPNDFDMDGTLDVLLTPGGGPFVTGEINGGIMTTIPWRIEAKIPNIWSWLPPLAEIDIDNAAFTGTTPQFTVGGAGNFSTDVVMTPVDGTITVYPLVGSTTTSNLADFGPTDPTPMSGTILESGGTVTLHSPVDIAIVEDDGAGTWIEFNLWGDFYATAPTQNDMTLSSGAVVAGSNATFDIVDAPASSLTFLAYGLRLGSTPVPPLGITLDIAAAKQVGSAVRTDGNGSCSWTVPVPPKASGVTIYMQACQHGETSNVLTVTVQ